MANCTYAFKGPDGKRVVIEGQAAFKAFLAEGGLQRLAPGAAAKMSPGRAPYAWAQQSRNENGPVYVGRGFSVEAIRKLNAETDFEDDNGLPFGHAAHVQGTPYRFAILNERGDAIGFMDAEVNDFDEIDAVHDIEMKDKRQGVGRRVIETVMANAYDGVRIIDVVPDAVPFWDRMGAGFYDQYQNTTLDWDTYQRESVRSGRTSAEGAARSGQVRTGQEAQAQEVRFSPGRQTESPESKAFLTEGGLERLKAKKSTGRWYFSPLERAIEQAPDRVFGPAAQVKLWLAGNAGKLGIKADEIQWSGINEWLDLQGKQKVSKDQVMAYLQANGVQVEEVMKGGKKFDRSARIELESLQEIPRANRTESEVGRIRELQDMADSELEVQTKYHSYALPGGENYRELLLTLPEKKIVKPYGQWLAENFTGADSAEARRVYAQQVDISDPQYRSSHWDERNILAHVRFNDRTDAEGNKVLFIEEIQSDWGQEGKRKGFNVKGTAKPDPQYQGKAWMVEWSDGTKDTMLAEEVAKHVAKTGKVEGGTAPAPFVTDTKAWVALALKRMIAYAAENGYDKVAFVNGEQSAERYDLSKQVEEVAYNKGTQFLRVLDKGSREVINKTVPLSELEDTLGKEVAQKIADGGNFVQLRGLDLKVGGEGMKTFYDKIVPQTVSEVLKKVGGGKLESVAIKSSQGPGSVDPRTGVVLGPKAKTKAYETQQSGFAITHAMREKVAGGLPLFSRGRIGQAIDDTIAKVDHAVDGLSNMPNQFDYLKDRYLALGRVARVDEIVKEIRKAFETTDPANKQAVYDYLTTKGANAAAIPNAEIRAMAQRIKKTIEYVGDQLVARGLLDQQARDHYRDQYLPRMYLRHMLSDQDYKIIGMGKKPSDMGYLKHRKDIPTEIREVVLGEVKDPAFLSANAIGRAMRDVALLDWMGKISQNNDWVFPEIFVNWQGKRVTAYWLRSEADRIEQQSAHYTPANKTLADQRVAAMRQLANQTLGQMSQIDHKRYKQIPDTRRYGLLRGMWVRKEIFDDIMGASQIVNADPTWFEDWFGFGGRGTQLTQWWKFTKVALNPPGQIRNFLSNMVMLQLSGVGLHKLPFRLIQAAREITSNGKYWQVAKKYGVTESTFTAQEMFRIKRDLIELEAKQGKLNHLRWLMAAGARFLDGVSNLYQFSEALGKTIKIIDEMEAGKSEAEAALEAQKWLFDYSLVPQSVRIARNAPVGMPFLTYQVKVLPRLLEVAAKHPWRFLPWAGLLYGMEMYVASLFGVDDDELRKLKKALPEWLQDRGHTVFLPVRDKDGRLQVADVGYFFPWTFYSTAIKHAGEGNMKKLLADDIFGQFSAPIIGAGSALISNYDNFTKKPIYNEGDPVAYQAAAIANYTYDLMAPPFLSSHGFASPMGLLDKRYGGKIVQAETGTTNKFGDPKATEGQAIGALIGANFYGMDPEHTRVTNMQVMNAKVLEAEKLLRARLMDRGLSPEQRQAYLRDYQARMSDLTQEMLTYAKESEVPDALKVKK